MFRGKTLVNPFVAVAILFIICQIFRGQHEVAAARPAYNRTVFINATIPKTIFDIRNPLPTIDHICEPGKTYVVSLDKRRINLDYLMAFKNEPEIIGNLAPCNVCICSLDGLREECLNRTGNGTNECVQMAISAKNKHLQRPHNQWSSLFNRIRKANEAKLLRSVSQCEPFTSRLRTCVTDSTVELCRTCTCTEQAQWHCHQSQTPLIQQEDVDSGVHSEGYDDVELSPGMPEYSIPPRGIMYDSPEDDDPAPALEDRGSTEQVFRVPHYPVPPAQPPMNAHPVGVVHTFYV